MRNKSKHAHPTIVASHAAIDLSRATERWNEVQPKGCTTPQRTQPLRRSCGRGRGTCALPDTSALPPGQLPRQPTFCRIDRSVSESRVGPIWMNWRPVPMPLARNTMTSWTAASTATTSTSGLESHTILQ
jgi:hypothetical protein